MILKDGTEVLVSECDFELLSRFAWHKHSKNYVAGRIGSGYVLMHRFIMGAKGNLVVHHRDGNPLNNTRENLVITDHGTNNHSRHGVKKFPFLGVTYDKRSGKYQASIRHKGPNIRIGKFDTPLEAAKAYDRKAKELYGDAAMTNERFLKSLLAKLKSTK